MVGNGFSICLMDFLGFFCIIYFCDKELLTEFYQTLQLNSLPDHEEKKYNCLTYVVNCVMTQLFSSLNDYV